MQAERGSGGISGDILARLVEDNVAVIDTSAAVLALLQPSVPGEALFDQKPSAPGGALYDQDPSVPGGGLFDQKPSVSGGALFDQLDPRRGGGSQVGGVGGADSVPWHMTRCDS